MLFDSHTGTGQQILKYPTFSTSPLYKSCHLLEREPFPIHGINTNLRCFLLMPIIFPRQVMMGIWHRVLRL